MKRSLGRFDITCLGLNAIVGSGIFLLPDDLHRLMGAYSPFAFVLCAVGLLPVAWCYAEAAGSVDNSGGPYVYARRAWGPRAGFIVGWMCFSNAIFSFAAVASAASASIGRLLPAFAEPLQLRLLSLAIVGVFTALNYWGAKPSAIAVDAFTLAKFGVLLLLLFALVPEALAPEVVGAGSSRVVSAVDTNINSLSAISAATFVALFAVQGFEVVPVPAGETHNPKRHVPFAVLTALGIASVLYVGVQTVWSAAYGQANVVSDTPLTDAALAVAPQLGWIVAAGAVISTLGFVSGSALGTPRYLFAAAFDRELPFWLSGVHSRFGTPHRAILVTSSATCLLALAFDYRDLLGMSNVAVAVQYLATSLAVIVFRRAQGRRGIRIWLVPLLGAAVSVWVFTEASRAELVWAAIAMGFGWGLRLLPWGRGAEA